MTTFVITRTSQLGADPPPRPCDEAYEGTALHIDYRTFDTKERYEAACPARINVRPWANGWCGDAGEIACWFIDLADLDALLAFEAKYGRLIVGTPFWNQDLAGIEIYDDYRE